MKELFLTSMILGLFALGLLIALRSGVASLSTIKGLRIAAGNASAMVLRIIGYGVGLLAVQRAIGLPTVLDW